MLYIIDPTFISFEEPSSYLFSFLCFSLVTIGVIKLPELTKTGLNTGSDKTVQALHSWFLTSLCIVESSILMNWMNPFVMLGVSGLPIYIIIFIEVVNFMQFYANSMDKDQRSLSTASERDLCCFLMPF